MADTTIETASNKYALLTLLFGSSESHDLANRLFNLISFLFALTTAILAALAWFNDNSDFSFYLSLLVMLTSGSFYLSSIKYQNDQILRLPLISLIVVVLIVNWMTASGLKGNTPIYFMSIFVAARMLLNREQSIWMFSILFSVITALIIIDVWFPEAIGSVHSDSRIKTGLSFSLITCLAMITLCVHMVVTEYANERNKNVMLINETLKDKEALEKAIAEIKVLEGILPVCSFCKNIRDENNEWHSMETYLSTHSEAKFTHGFCPDCGNQHYPEFVGNDSTE